MSCGQCRPQFLHLGASDTVTADTSLAQVTKALLKIKLRISDNTLKLYRRCSLMQELFRTFSFLELTSVARVIT